MKSLSVAIHSRYLAVFSCDAVYIMLYNVVHTFESGWNLKVFTIQMKVTWQYFAVVLFIMLYKVVLTFSFVDEILKCDRLNKNYWAVLSCGAVYYAVQGGSNFWVCRWNPEKWLFK